MARTLRIGIIACLLGAGTMLGTSPAQADCTRAELVVYWSDGTEQTVWPSSQCIVDLGDQLTAPAVTAKDDDDNIPPGYPEGVRAQVWLAVPLP